MASRQIKALYALLIKELASSLITYYTYLVGLKKVSNGCQGMANVLILQLLVFMSGNILLVASSLFYTVQILHYVKFNEWIVLGYEPLQQLLPAFLAPVSKEYGVSSLLLVFGLMLIGLSFYINKKQKPLDEEALKKEAQKTGL